MKYFMILIAAVFILSLIPGCGSDEKAAGVTITSRIDALETAINAHDYEGYLACFASSSSYSSSYTEGQFDNKFGSAAPYTTYDFGEVTVSGTTATCNSTKSASGTTTFANEFTMVQEADSWYIETWKEDDVTVWQVPARR